jgi:hypothetical protein
MTSKLKEPLFYSLHRSMYGVSGYKVVAVTTYKERRGRWHGRYVDDNSGTHGAGDLEGRFDAPEKAQAAIAGLAAIEAKHKAPIDAARRAYDAAQRAERDEINTYLKGLPR